MLTPPWLLYTPYIYINVYCNMSDGMKIAVVLKLILIPPDSNF